MRNLFVGVGCVLLVLGPATLGLLIDGFFVDVSGTVIRKDLFDEPGSGVHQLLVVRADDGTTKEVPAQRGVFDASHAGSRLEKAFGSFYFAVDGVWYRQCSGTLDLATPFITILIALFCLRACGPRGRLRQWFCAAARPRDRP